MRRGSERIWPEYASFHDGSDPPAYHLEPRRRARGEGQGWYRQIFSVCPDKSTKWNRLGFLASVSVGTKFIVRARTADQQTDLVSAKFVTVHDVPPDTSPVDPPPDLPEGHFIELAIHLYAKKGGVSPAVDTIGFDFECTDDVSTE